MLESRKNFKEASGIYEYVFIPADCTDEEAKRVVLSALLQYGKGNKHLRLKPITDVSKVCKYGTMYISGFDDMDSQKKMALINEANYKNITIRTFRVLNDEEIKIFKSRFKK